MKKKLLNGFPFLLAAYPIIALRGQNLEFVAFPAIVRPLLLSFIITSSFFLLFRVVLKEWEKASLMTTLVITLFFIYGHVYTYFQTKFTDLIRHSYIVIAFSLLFLLIGVWILYARRTLAIRQFFTVFSLILLAFPLLEAFFYDYSLFRATVLAKEESRGETEYTQQVKEQDLPDIYMIILDGYTRSDVLEDVYDFDNSYFIEELSSIGFYIASCSQSNYPITKFSLSSIMNADYLENYSNLEILPPLKSSLVAETVQDFGYTTIAFENSVGGHFDLGEDVLISRKKQSLSIVDFTGGVNEFEAELIKTTLFKLLYDMPQLVPGFQVEDLQRAEHYEHYRQTFFILDELEKIPERDGHNFVFTHILVPHPPYIFTPSGEFYWTDQVRTGYPSNVEFISTHLLPVLKTIIETSDFSPIIIIQGDHGPYGNFITPEMRLSILNAYYIDTEAQASLYSTITPVNSFRVVFNHYFGTDLPMLDDISYFMNTAEEFSQDSIVENTCVPE